VDTPLRVNRRVLVSAFAVLAGAIALPSGLVNASQATPAGSSGSFVTTAGREVTWSEPWVFNEERSHLGNENVQVLQFDNDDFLIRVEIGYIPDIEHSLDLHQQSVGGDTDQRVTLDGGVGDPVSYWLDQLPVNGVPYGSFAFAQVGGDRTGTMTVFLAPVTSFADGFASAQAGIAIDGTAVFDGAEGDGLQDLLVAAAPAAGDNMVDGGSPKLGDFDEDEETGSWTEPVYGFDVTWSGEWESSERNETTLVLESENVILNLTATRANGATTRDLAEFVEDAMADFGVEVGPSATYLDEDNLIVAGELEAIPFIQEWILIDDDIAISITVTVNPVADLDDVIAYYRDSVEIAGVAPLDGWEEITLQSNPRSL